MNEYTVVGPTNFQPRVFNAFDNVWLLDGVRTPMVDYCGAIGHVSPTDLGIKAAREALVRAKEVLRRAGNYDCEYQEDIDVIDAVLEETGDNQ